MPTPESEAFLAKKPTVPPTFAGVDFNNYQQVVDARDAIIREKWVQRMMARLVREEMGTSLLGIVFGFNLASSRKGRSLVGIQLLMVFRCRKMLR